MTLIWHGAARAEEVVNLGPLALIQPLLDQLDIASIIDRHLPPDPQLEFSHGQVLSLLLAARLCQPTALINLPAWADKTGADILWNLSADKLNDDRLGRALDAFFEQRHSIFASTTATALHLTNLSLGRLHFDTTHLTFWGAYETSQTRPATPLSALRGDAQLPPAHIGHGYVTEELMIQVGLTAVVDRLGGLPVFSQCLDGQRNGRRAIAEQFHLLQQHLPLPTGLLMISDRGTYSAEHVSRLYRHGYYALCSMRWNDYQAVYDAHAQQLHWQQASFLSVEQHRRRQTNSTLPRLLNHQMKTPLAVRPVFLKSPRRVEALVSLLQIALQAYQVLERRYRQTVPEDAPASEQRMTAEMLLRQFRVYGCIVTSESVGRVIHTTRLTSRQRQILNQLSLPTPAQMLRRILAPVPTG